MKRNTIIYLVIFVALGAVAVVLWLRKSESTLPQALTDFEVADTAGITKMHLTDHFKNDITLVRKGTGWWRVNDKYNAKQTEIQTLLETIKEVKVKNPLPKAARDIVIRDLATNGIKIEIYSGDALSKTYYVGSSTANDEGTTMMLQGSSEPFVTHIPGFVGYLTTRYITTEQAWRSTDIFHLNPADIKTVTVTYPGNPDKSFMLAANGNTFSITHPAGSGGATLSPLTAKNYLVRYRAINFEVFPTLTASEHDSILKTAPYAIVSVTTSAGPQPVLTLYPKLADIKTKDKGANNLDLDRFYGTLGKGSKEIVMVQNFVVGKLLTSFDDLVSGKAVTGK